MACQDCERKKDYIEDLVRYQSNVELVDCYFEDEVEKIESDPELDYD